VQLPTGGGKTVLAARMVKAAHDRKVKTWFTVHRKELLDQSVRTFGDGDITAGVIAPDFTPNLDLNTQIASVQTLARRYTRLSPPGLIFWDEAHHVAAGTWAKIFEAFPSAFHVGLTATPERLDGKGLSNWFDEMVCGPDTAELIAKGYLSPYVLYGPPAIQVDGLHTRFGDYKHDELDKAANKPTITGDAIKHYKKHCEGKRAVVFCVSVEHSRNVVALFRASGFNAEHVDGSTPKAERRMAVDRFRRGATQILSNVELFGEGFDLPAIEAAILLRPTQSMAVYLQQIGRALRTYPGKTHATILDHAGNWSRHGLPDQPREWSLNGRAEREKNERNDGPSVRVCPSCFAAVFIGRPTCAYCGHEFPIKPREVQQVEGELEKVDPAVLQRQKQEAKWKRLSEQSAAKDLDALIALGRARGHKRPEFWARCIWRSRMNKRR